MHIIIFYLALFFLPGIAFSIALRTKNEFFLSSVLYSLLLLIIICQLVSLTAFSPENIYFFFICPISLIILLFYLMVKYTIFSNHARDKRLFNSFLSIRNIWRNYRNYIFVLIIGSLIWMIGPFSEIPADVWQHLENIRLEKSYLDQGSYLLRNPWYLFQAMLWRVSGADFDSFFRMSSFLNTTLLLSGVFFFTSAIARNSGYKKDYSVAAGLTSVALFMLFFGMGYFSYMRYYAFSPTIPAFVIFLLSIVKLDMFFKSRMMDIRNVAICSWLIFVSLLVCFLIHKQEAAFIVVAMVSLFGWKIIKKISKNQELSCIGKKKFGKIPYELIFLACVTMITFIAGMVISWAVKDIQIMHRDFLDLGNIIKNLSGIYLLKINSQFFHVIGVFGIITMILTIPKKFRDHIPSSLWIITAGVAIIAFNPITPKIFEILVGAEVTWRLAYLMPFYAIGSFFIVSFIANNKNRLLQKIKIRRNVFLFIGILILSALFFNSEMSLTSKYYTLKSTAESNNYKNWDDLISFLEKYPDKKDMLTDPVTGYFLASTTHHKHKRWKFYPIKYQNFNKPGYTDSSFKDYAGWLLVVNLRPGGWSELGSKSEHWPGDILVLEKFYTSEFLEFVANNDRFDLVWSKDNVSVYEIN